MSFFFEVLIGGLLSGIMYSLVALGFVLIFKASGVFNFAQGVMVLFAALTLVGLIERGAGVVLALALTALVMVLLAFGIERIIDFLEIQAIRKTQAGKLPYGLQKRVELARALAAEPTLLLLDEPMAGMNVEEKQDMCRFVLDVNDEFGTTVVLIEHDMGVVMDISDRVVVLDYGKKIGDGTPDEVRNNPEVIKAYLGTSE